MISSGEKAAATFSLGHAGADRLFGGDDDDSLDGGSGDDVSYGGAGDDALRDPEGGNDSLWGDDGDDRLTIDRYQSTPGERLLLSGGAGHDIVELRLSSAFVQVRPTVTIDGGTGDDFVRASGLMDTTIDLGDGNDRLIVSGLGQCEVTLATATMFSNSAAGPAR